MELNVSLPLRRGLREGWATCAALLFQPACAGCATDVEVGALCCACRQGLERRAMPACPRCGERLWPGQACRGDHRALTGITFHCAPLRYRGTGARLVHQLKFRRDMVAGRFLVRELVGALAPRLRGDWRRALVVSVPRHAKKRRQEGFDPGEWLGERVAERLGLPWAGRALQRTRPTLSQADPRVTNRDANVAGALTCRLPWAISGRHVVLIDDVLTSGATARASAQALLEGGAAAVAVATTARA